MGVMEWLLTGENIISLSGLNLLIKTLMVIFYKHFVWCPQNSILGTLFFISYINDISYVSVSSSLLMIPVCFSHKDPAYLFHTINRE